MNRKSLLNQLELAYAPLTAYEFANIKDDPIIERALEKASIYIIGQRPAITFENVIPDLINYELNFEIHQSSNSSILNCKLPLIQPIVGSIKTDNIGIYFNYLDKSTEQDNLPFNNVHGFSLAKEEKGKSEFLIWFSPEKLLQDWLKGYIECVIYGDFKSFRSYRVHYVGKATKQNILKRLTGHSTLQDILSLESSVTKKQLPANEIVILPFEFRDNLQIQTFGPGSIMNDMVASVLGENYPEQEKIYLDAEKALIKAMKPAYNKELFKNYPISKDGLYNDNYHSISYTFTDSITLLYSNGEINGGLSSIGGDSISILENSKFELVKHNSK